MGDVAELWVYPLKGARGVPLLEAVMDERGLRDDRALSVVDDDGDWITSRGSERFALAQVETTIKARVLTLCAPAMGAVSIDLCDDGSVMPKRHVIVKGQHIEVGEEVEGSAWFSEYLHRPCHLIHMTGGSVRTADPSFSAEKTQIPFVDNFPLLVTSQESLDELNGRMTERSGEGITMRRFRPNIVIAGFRSAYENCMKSWRAGGVQIDRARPCDRCIATLIHEDGKTQTKDPLATLQAYRRANWTVNGKEQHPVIFGEYAVHMEKGGTLRVGDAIEVFEEAEDGWDRPINLQR